MDAKHPPTDATRFQLYVDEGVEPQMSRSYLNDDEPIIDDRKSCKSTPPPRQNLPLQPQGHVRL